VNSDELDHIMKIIPTILKKYPNLFQITEEHIGWYEQRVFFLKSNSVFLDKIFLELGDEIKEYSKEDLFYMQKLFLLYPDHAPKKLLSLSWHHIKILLNLYSLEKRNFYTDMCIRFHWNEDTLEFYILNDLYEKNIALIQEVQDYNIINQEEFLQQCLDIQSLVYEEL